MKKVLANNQQVAHYFANKVQSEGSASNFFFENDRLYSYGKHFCIARHLPGGKVAFTTRKHSVSTAKHLSYARQALRGQDLVYCNDPDSTARANRDEAEQDIIAALNNAATARRIRPETREGYRIEALNIAERFNLYLEALPEDEAANVQPFDTAGADMEPLRQARIERDAAAQKARDEEQTRRAESQREALADWLAGGANRGGMLALPVALRLAKSKGTHHTGGLMPDAGSVGRDVIQTSHGAEIPLADALALWPLVQKVRAGELSPDMAARMVRRVGVYTFSAFDAQGGIRVGCHTISYEALFDMAHRLAALGLLPVETA